jgi:hypothetical protein
MFQTGAQSDSCIVIRPNRFRVTESKFNIRQKLMNGQLTSGVSVDQAMTIWKREFDLADIPYSEEYQFSCKGRHQEVSLFYFSVL